MTSNEAIIYGYAINQLGLSQAGAAAALGNAEVETGGTFSPTAYNPGEQAIGFVQWEGGRRAALQAYAAAHGGKETDIRIQLGFWAQELTNPANFAVLSKLRSARTSSDAAAAAAYYDANYERSSGAARGTRVADSQTIYQQIQSQQLTPQKAPAGTPSPAGGAAGGDPPYGPNDLSVGQKLSPEQRSRIIAWLKSRGVTGSLTKLPDAMLIAQYAAEYEIWKVNHDPLVNNPLSGILGGVTTLVVKGVFTLGGLGLVVLGLAAAARPAAEDAAGAAAGMGAL